MCYRTQLNTKIKKIEETFDAQFLEPEAYSPQEEINAFSFPMTPVITAQNREAVDQFHWGLIPFWAKDEKIRNMTLNARIETIEEKPAFRNAVSNRCLIIASGFYEWQWLDPKGKVKQKYFIRPTDQEVFGFAGIYSTWANPQNGRLIQSYSIFTTEANDLMSEIHNIKKRMPVTLRKQDHNSWLSGAPVENFAFPYEADLQAEVR